MKTSFPLDWHEIGGNYESCWDYKKDSLGKTFAEITNCSAGRAGIIQTQGAALDVSARKTWIIKVLLKSKKNEPTAYLRVYRIKVNGEVTLPMQYKVKPGLEPEWFRKVIQLDSGTKALRLETGILGRGCLSIFDVKTYPLTRILKGKQDINHIQTIGEILKPIRLAMPIPLKIPVNVQATVNSDIRNLSPIRDKVQVYGSTQVPLATSAFGRAQVDVCGHEFYESIEDVRALQTRAATVTRDVSGLLRFSLAVYNFGDCPAYFQIEFSPDGLHWAAEDIQRVVKPESLVIVSPGGYLRYTRVSYWANDSAALRIWIQAQG